MAFCLCADPITADSPRQYTRGSEKIRWTEFTLSMTPACLERTLTSHQYAFIRGWPPDAPHPASVIPYPTGFDGLSFLVLIEVNGCVFGDCLGKCCRRLNRVQNAILSKSIEFQGRVRRLVT